VQRTSSDLKVNPQLHVSDSRPWAGSGSRGGPGVPETGRFYSLDNRLDLVFSVAPTGHGMGWATYAVSRHVGHLSL
jgi:hypothetical protein